MNLANISYSENYDSDNNPITQPLGTPSPEIAQIYSITKKIFHNENLPVHIEKIPGGKYNSTFLLTFDQKQEIINTTDDTHTNISTAIFRLAPPVQQQFISERYFMRNEYAAFPYLTVIAPLLPTIITADFTSEYINRDYMIYSHLPGKNAKEAFPYYSDQQKLMIFEQLGKLVATLATVSGKSFGSFLGPVFPTWSQYLNYHLSLISQDYRACNLPLESIELLQKFLELQHHVFDQITTPRLVHGDLWLGNVIFSSSAPKITGVIDWDRALWADPLSDWSFFMARQKDPTEREAFYSGYCGGSDNSNTSIEQHVRNTFYTARNLATTILERYRLGVLKNNDKLLGTLMTATQQLPLL